MPETTTSRRVDPRIGQAGGTVTGTLSLTQEFVDANSGRRNCELGGEFVRSCPPVSS
jgi:hypothetical protein